MRPALASVAATGVSTAGSVRSGASPSTTSSSRASSAPERRAALCRSSARTFVVPSHMGITCVLRTSAGSAESSQYPTPPRHSMASAVPATAQRAVASFATGVSPRSTRCSCSVAIPCSARPVSSQHLRTSARAAAWSTARSANVARCAGSDDSGRPPTRRTSANARAHARPRPSAPAAFNALWTRVRLSIVAIRRSPAPSGSPTGHATAPSSSSSAVGNERVPSLSLSRRTTMPLERPSSPRRCTRNNARPRDPSGAPSGRASVSATSDVVALVNHFVPYRRQTPSPSRRATVSVPPTSEPPVVSVIHWPLVHALSGSRETRRSTTSTSAGPPWTSSVRAAASVIATGQL
jgi:hypothetical protein